MRTPRGVPTELTEADIASQQAATRGQLVLRLETLYAWCMDNLGSGEDDTPDPRFAELAVRITDRLSKLYRLERIPVEKAPELDVAEDAARTRALVAMQLTALSQRGLSSEPVVTVSAAES